MQAFKISIQSKKSKARVGVLRTAHGKIRTPFFMTIATRGAVKTLAAEDMKQLKAPILLSNTYHLYVRPTMAVIKKAGGLHNFMGWEGPILTDSGGYQVFSLAQKRVIPDRDRGSRIVDSRFRGNDNERDYDVRITRDGAEFVDRLSGRKDMFTPEHVLEIQKTIGSDIAMVLDVCAPYPISKKSAKAAMEMTSEWARRSKMYNVKLKMKSLVFGIIQGSVYKDLRERSAQDITALNFDGYAIGGVAVGESQKEKYAVVDWVEPYLPKNKPRYLMGLGQPEELVEAVKRGIDMFDCVLPTRNARHGLLYVRSRAWNNSSGLFRKEFYETLHISNEKYRADLKPVDPHCSCFTCINHSRAYLRHLFNSREPLALRLATIHNVKFYLELMECMQKAIVEGDL